MDSAIGLSTMIAIGPEHFRRHAPTASTRWTSIIRTAPFERNLPVLMGASGLLVQHFLRRADRRGPALMSSPEALPRVPRSN